MAEETKRLFPTFAIPQPDQYEHDYAQRFLPCPFFDFDAGDFVRDGSNRIKMVDGRDAFILWTYKIMATELGGCLCYLDEGVDFDACFAEHNRAAAQSALERNITEAIMKNPGTQKVTDFIFEWESDSVDVTFTVKPYKWPAFDIHKRIVRG